MKKIPHIYISKGEFPLNTVSFTIVYDGLRYGHFEEGFRPEDKFKVLRKLIVIKYGLRKDLMRIEKNIRSCKC